MDFNNTSYTIDEITPDGSILVTFGCDGNQQTINGTMTVTEVTEIAGELQNVERRCLLDLSADGFKARLDAYCLAYIDGLRSQQVAPSPDINSLVGQPQIAQG
jgi:hypothetical protein